jgi:ABC-2 type transport system ATP-binding protein
MTYAIETAGLTRRFRRVEAVEDLTLQVPTGSIFALVGPNGAGKTTTIKVLMNLMQPTRGTATVLGRDSRGLDVPTLQRIGYVSENQKLPDHLTPAALLDYCRPFYPTWDNALAERLQQTLNLPMAGRLRTLSRGTRMKAALLSALAYRPELLVLDEPFSGLDPLVRDELIQALLELANDRDRPWTVFISSHDIEEVERLADSVAFLDNGHIVFAEPVARLLERFRLVEVIAPDDAALSSPSEPAWIPQGVAGRTLRFVDTDHASPDASSRIATHYPNAEIRTHPMALRDIFVALARRSAREPRKGAVS